MKGRYLANWIECRELDSSQQGGRTNRNIIRVPVNDIHNIQQLLDEVEHDSENYQGRGLSYLQKPKAEADNKPRPNSIIILLYNYKCRSLEEV